jgi:ketosteroid isomerase-like protein
VKLRRLLGRLLAPMLAVGVIAAARAEAPTTPSDTVEAFHKALRQGDGKAALAFMLRDVTVFEQGYTENSRDDWGNHQLPDANQFAKQTERRVLRREAAQDTATAWVMSTTLTSGEFDGRKLELEGTETMLLRREGDGWRIAHIHWSAHPLEAAAPAAP